MQGMHVAVFHGLAGCQHGLRQYLAAEHPRGSDVTALAAEQIDLQLLQAEQLLQLFESMLIFCH